MCSVEKELYRNWHTRVMKGNQRQAKRDRARKYELSAAGQRDIKRKKRGRENWEDYAVENKVKIGSMKQLVQSCIDFDAHLRPKLLDRLGERMRSC